MEIKNYSTNVADVYYKNEIMYVKYKKGEFSMSDIKLHIAGFVELYADVFPVLALSDISAQKNPPKEMRDYMGSEEVLKNIKASAIIADSVFTKTLGNLYITFSRPKTPTKIFSNVEIAEAWLRTFP